MAKVVNIGGDRLGSGNKINTALKNYSRSTHNLTETFRSSIAPGVLYPFLCKLAMNGDTFDIDINSAIRTIPTQGPLFGSFKMQADLFMVPIRLYQKILHNNPLNIGMKMNQVYLPKMRIIHKGGITTADANQFSNSCLMKYLGLSGIGTLPKVTGQQARSFFRDINAVPMLGYYDIFKVYYANKQEQMAYQFVPSEQQLVENTIKSYIITTNGGAERYGDIDSDIFEITFGASDSLLMLTTTSKATKDDWTWGVNDGQASINFAGCSFNEKTKAWDNLFYIKPLYGDIEAEFRVKNYQTYNATPILEAFPLEAIDEMRNTLLEQGQLGAPVILTASESSPYATNMDTISEYSNNCCNLNGLCVKTYQSDYFNSWINSEWIDGENGINALTAIDTSTGSFTLDALNIMQKQYNVLNRVAASGGTYEDWQEAVWTQKAIRKAETPVYCGGLSKEVVFEEVIQTSADNNGLGTLGGRGTYSGKHKGGHMIIKVNEPCFIMGIVSITPRISYSQGNEFYLTDLDTLDDLHKPELDEIGYQNLIGERAAWFDTNFVTSGGVTRMIRNSYGKQPAWLDYMTSVDKCYGDFADRSAFMVLTRQFEKGINSDGTAYIKDFTTYIDPSKYNYAFAYDAMDAQNFWLVIQSDIKARRIMSAKVIPNL